jgi:FkbH-like protein
MLKEMTTVRDSSMGVNISDAIHAIQDKLKKGDVASAMLGIRTIAAESLRLFDYQKISRLVDEYRNILIEYLGNEPLRIAILGGYTTQPISVTLRTFLLTEGYLADIYESEYNSYKMEVLNPESGLYAFKPHTVLFATGSINIDTFPALGSTIDEVESTVNTFVEGYQHLWSTVKKQINVPIIQHNFEPLEERILGRLEYKYPWSRSRFKQRINERFWELDGKDVHILDVYGLTVRIGVYNWFDPRWYYHSKYGYNPDFAFEYGRLFTGLYRAIIGKAKKCLVTDLDNTLWGGIVGDDGVHGIHLGSISSQGEAYKAFCNYLKALKNRGVILAVCSKNAPTLAREVFTQHPEMPLALDDFAAFRCNWEGKSSNLGEIAKELNIGTDALVFIDDNPVECAEVREMMPEVVVVEMSGDPAYFIRKMNQQHLFDQLDITNEDFNRSETYATQRKIREAKQSSTGLENFLVNLGMTARFCPAGQEDVPRIEQMFKKTNQFNLTSRRYERDAILEFINNEKNFCLPCWLKDKFVNYGLVSVVVGDIKEGKLQISNWVMSCRVFSRTLEQYIFNELKTFARKQGCSLICGEFISTAKNSYVKELYSKLGFTSESNKENGPWFLRLSDAPEIKSYVASEQA